MQRLKLYILFLFVAISLTSYAQDDDGTNFSIYYSSPKEYTIQDIQIVGIKYLDTNTLVQLSGLAVGDEVMVPGETITTAIKKLWAHQLFSDVRIEANKVVGDKIWLTIHLQERPRLAGVNFIGVSKSEQKDIEEKVLLLKGSQVVDNQLMSAERIISGIYAEKGYSNAEVNIVQRDDTTKANNVWVDIIVNKKEKVKIQEVVFHGAENLSPGALDKAMKKTNSKKLRNFFRTKKYSEELYAEDKRSLIAKYNENGYRDATILSDSITALENGRVRVDIHLEEGNKYYLGDIQWMGNTVYASDYLTAMLGFEKGDVFDQKKLDERLTIDDDAVGNLYLDNGYLFYFLDPVEASIEGDTINYEMRISEGIQATINNVFIEGNTRTNEHVARREIRTYPGDLFSKSQIIRSVRELSQLGHFNPEAIEPDVQPHPENGTVDIAYKLEEQSNQQVEVSGGWGAGQFVGTLGLRFSNFSMSNFFNKEAWKPLPTGDGQTLSLRAQTSGKFYTSYGFSFIEPWLGGKKPNSLSVSFNRTSTNYSANRSLYGYNQGFNYYNQGGSYYPNNYFEDNDASDDQIQVTTSLSVGYGYRLKWPDDFFTMYHQVAFERYALQNMAEYYDFLGADGGADGEFNNLSFLTAFSRNSLDQPLYPRRGSDFGLSVQFTFPYSLVNGVDYSKSNISDQDRYRWIEYHKWKFNGTWYTPVSKNTNLVLMSKFEYGFLGYYNKDRRSPFERFRVGGSGMSGYSLYGTDIVSLRGYRDYSLSPGSGSNLYNKVTVELRYPVIMSPSATIYLLGFLEGGNAWMDFEKYNPFELKRSAGVGVRLFLPMFGLMGFDWGYGFDEINGSKRDGGSQIHFTIGQQF